jgi:hypothetical protein
MCLDWMDFFTRELEESWWSRSHLDQEITCKYLNELGGLTSCSA